LLLRGARPDAVVGDLGPLICAAARDKHWDVVYALARAGADVNAADRDYGYTQSDGFGDAEERRDEEGGDASGYDACCFYHRQDVEGAIDGRGLYIAFGSFKSKQGDVKIGRRIEYRLGEAGLRVEWDGTAETRLHLPQLDFRRRGIPTE
jgi:hypothetical protein